MTLTAFQLVRAQAVAMGPPARAGSAQRAERKAAQRSQLLGGTAFALSRTAQSRARNRTTGPLARRRHGLHPSFQACEDWLALGLERVDGFTRGGTGDPL